MPARYYLMEQTGVNSHEVIQLRLKVWHPGCWLIEVTEQVPVGLLGFGTFTHTDGTATTRYTMYGDDQETIDRGLSLLREKDAVLEIAEMGTGFIHPTAPTPGNATHELLIENDPTPQISDEFTSRGFAYAAPVDVFDGVETWALYTRLDLAKVQATQAAVDNANDAIQYHGGMGYTTKHHVERYLRDAKLLTLAGGPNEGHKDTVAEEVLSDQS